MEPIWSPAFPSCWSRSDWTVERSCPLIAAWRRQQLTFCTNELEDTAGGELAAEADACGEVWFDDVIAWPSHAKRRRSPSTSPARRDQRVVAAPPGNRSRLRLRLRVWLRLRRQWQDGAG